MNDDSFFEDNYGNLMLLMNLDGLGLGGGRRCRFRNQCFGRGFLGIFLFLVRGHRFGRRTRRFLFPLVLIALMFYNV